MIAEINMPSPETLHTVEVAQHYLTAVATVLSANPINIPGVRITDFPSGDIGWGRTSPHFVAVDAIPPDAKDNLGYRAYVYVGQSTGLADQKTWSLDERTIDVTKPVPGVNEAFPKGLKRRVVRHTSSIDSSYSWYGEALPTSLGPNIGYKQHNREEVVELAEDQFLQLANAYRDALAGRLADTPEILKAIQDRAAVIDSEASKKFTVGQRLRNVLRRNR